MNAYFFRKKSRKSLYIILGFGMGFFRDPESQIPIPGIPDRDFYFGRKITKFPGSEFEDLEKIPNEKSRKYRMLGIQDFFGIFYLRDGDFFREMGYPDKKSTLLYITVSN